MTSLLNRDKLVFEPPRVGSVLYLPGLPGGGNKIYDRSPYGNVGTITGATWKRLPSGLWALNFDGDDWINLGTPVSLQITTMSILVWVKRSAIGGQIILGSEINGYGFGFAPGDVLMLTKIGVDAALGSRAITDTTTYHLVGVTYDGVTATFFIDGEVDIARAYANPGFVSNGKCIGCFSPSSPTYFFYGVIALLRETNTVLTGIDVQNTFKREKHLFGEW